MTVVRRLDAHSSHGDADARLGAPHTGQACLTCGQPLGQWARDALTGLLDRRGWESEAPRTFARARRQSRPVALLMVDIDCFKLVNDEYGHLAGDTLLTAVAAVIQNRSRPGDVVCRYGGDEFLVLLPSATADDALDVAHGIHDDCRALKTMVPLRGGKTMVVGDVTVSLGLAVHQAICDSDLVDRFLDADFALRQAKRRGRDLVSLQTGVACGCENSDL
jgi:diguanylate cyclase (GGDEF)-like protein